MSAAARPLIIKLDATPRRRADRIAVHFSEAGFQVINAASIAEGVRLGERAHPRLILALDALRNGLDAEAWLAAQHTSPSSTLAMTPLLILASVQRVQHLRIHELPDRVRVMPDNSPLSEILEAAQQILTWWSF